MWTGNGYDPTANALLVGAVAGGIRVLLELSVTPLSGYPVVVTSAGNSTSTGLVTFTDTDVRLGLVAFELSLVCDRFYDPSGLLSALAVEAGRSPNDPLVRGAETFTTSQNANALGQRGANLLLAGITSSTDSGAKGWNQLAQPTLLQSNASFTTLQLGR